MSKDDSIDEEWYDIPNYKWDKSCKNCKGNFLCLIDDGDDGLCYTCFGNVKGIPALLNLEKDCKKRSSEGFLRFCDNKLPENFAEIVKKRKIKTIINPKFDPDHPEYPSTLLWKIADTIITIINQNLDKLSYEDIVSEEQKNDWFNKAIQELDQYPELPSELKDIIVSNVRNEMKKTFEVTNSKAELIKTSKTKLMDMVRSYVTPEQYKKIDKVVELWIDDNESPEDISEADVISAAKGALHNIEKHKEKPNGFCKICNEHYNNGSVKVKLSDALKTIQESTQLYAATHLNVDKTLNRELVDAFVKKQNKEFEDTPQENIDDFLNKINLENDRIKHEMRIARHTLNPLALPLLTMGFPVDGSNPRKNKKDELPTYVEARAYALEQDCRSVQDWINHTKIEKFDTRFPINPHTSYKPIFQEKGGYPFFLGYTRKKHRPRLTKEEVQKIIKKFDERWVTDYQLYPDAILMNWFETQGLYKVKDPLEQILFKNLISWRKDAEGIKAIRFYFNGIITGNLEKLKQSFYNPETDRKFSLETKESYIDRQYTRLRDVKPQQLLANPVQVGVQRIMEDSLTVVPDEHDKEWWWFQVSYRIKLCWYAIMDEETGKAQLGKLLNEKKGKNKFHDAVLDGFLKEYKSVTTMSYKDRFYTYPKKPQVNQLYCAWMMRNRNFFFDMSSTGTGKSGCGIISAMSQNTKRCVIVCPLNIVVQWHRNVKKFYNSCFASHSEEHNKYIPNEFFIDQTENKANFHIINYDKFNREDSARTVAKQFELRNPVDMIILDESQRVKSAKEDEKEDTATRKNVALLIKQLRKNNRNLKVLMLSATPVVNKISEGKSLLEMGTGTEYNFSTYPTVLNASKLYTEFQPFCMRWVKNYQIDQRGKDEPIIIRSYVPEYMTRDQFEELHWDDFDEFNTKYRIATILKLIREAKNKKQDARIIVYTDYIDGIVDQLQIAFNDAGLRYGLFIGSDKSGMIRKTGKKDNEGSEIIENPFTLGELDVLIASSPIAIGVDDLQYNCNTIIFNGLVWTWAKFEQIVGRLVRTGQTQDHVNIHLVFANLNGYEYDYKVKYLRILAKKSIGDCVTTGTLPPKISLGSTEEQRHGMITKMWENKESGFPEKEQIERQLQLEAEHELELEIEKTNKFIETIQPVEKEENNNE